MNRNRPIPLSAPTPAAVPAPHRATSARPHGGLAALAQVSLDPTRRQRLADAGALCTGDAVWKRRKQAEARELLQLEMITPRMTVDFIDLRTDLRTLIRLRVPVACRAGDGTGHGELMIAGAAVLGITYPREAMWQVVPGFAFVQVLSPTGLFYPNVASGHDQRLCLGAQMLPGTRLREIVLGAYGALSMQTVQLDERDAAGVMNREAAHWWQEHLDRIPLSAVPFLGADDLEAPEPDANAAPHADAAPATDATPDGDARHTQHPNAPTGQERRP